MKILFISDIHGIAKNIDYLMELHNKESFDRIVVLGDLYGYLREDNTKILNFLTTHKNILTLVRGNCDSDKAMEKTNLPYFNSLAAISADGIEIYCTHGDKINDRNHNFLSGVLIQGHKHFPSIVKKDNMIYICPGSISMPRYGSPASYGIYFNKKFSIYDLNGKILNELEF